jgi:hypothetical protein
MFFVCCYYLDGHLIDGGKEKLEEKTRVWFSVLRDIFWPGPTAYTLPYFKNGPKHNLLGRLPPFHKTRVASAMRKFLFAERDKTIC